MKWEVGSCPPLLGPCSWLSSYFFFKEISISFSVDVVPIYILNKGIRVPLSQHPCENFVFRTFSQMRAYISVIFIYFLLFCFSFCFVWVSDVEVCLQISVGYLSVFLFCFILVLIIDLSYYILSFV